MPVADKFMSDGVGNGFPSCAVSEDVSTYDRWTTFSGVNKDNVGSFTAEQLEVKIQESLVLAMKFYWNGFSVDAYAEATVNGSTSIADGADVTGSDYELPKSRICGRASGESGEQVGSSFADIGLGFNQPARLINNGVFVGYGANGFPVGMRASAFGPRIDMILTGYIELERSSTTNILRDYAYVDTNGGSFVCRVYAQKALSSSTSFADAANMTGWVSRADLSRYAETTIETTDTFDFYTYPA